MHLEALWRDVTGDHARSVRIEMKGTTVVSDGLVNTALVRLTLAVSLWRRRNEILGTGNWVHRIPVPPCPELQ